MKTNDPATGDWQRPGRSRGHVRRGDRSGTVNLGVTPDTPKLTVDPPRRSRPSHKFLIQYPSPRPSPHAVHASVQPCMGRGRTGSRRGLDRARRSTCCSRGSHLYQTMKLSTHSKATGHLKLAEHAGSIPAVSPAGYALAGSEAIDACDSETHPLPDLARNFEQPPPKADAHLPPCAPTRVPKVHA
jgi:hypothetical protein